MESDVCCMVQVKPLYPSCLWLTSQGVCYATLQHATRTVGTPPRHQPGALRVLARRALLAARGAFWLLQNMQLLKTSVLHHTCPGGAAARHTLTLRFWPQEDSLPSRQLAASPEHRHLRRSVCPGVLALATLMPPAIPNMGIPGELPVAVPALEGMQLHPFRLS